MNFLPSAASESSPGRHECASVEQQAALDLAAKGTAGSLLYVAIWLLIIATTGMLGAWPVIAWAGTVCLTLTGAVRLVLSLGFSRLYPPSPVAWLRAYAVSAVGLGIVWGSLNAVLLWIAPFEWVSVLSSFATAGIVAGGTVSLTTHTRMARLYVVAMLLPSGLVCFALGGVQAYVFGALFMLDLAFMFVINRQASTEYWSALRNSALLEQRAAQLDAARARAEAADKAKSRFVATMSHEIRTPLNGVFGMIECLRDSASPAEQARYLAVMESSAHALLSVINGILDFSKIEAGMLALERTAYRPAAVVTEVGELFRGSAQAKGLRLAVDTAGVEEDCVLGDPTRLRQVLSNLVANAVKFTARGGLTMRVQSVRADDTGVHLHFSVSDSGIGMTPEVAARIFRAFEQADASTTRRHGGTGLGLAICHQLVELMGGELTVESSAGVGSTFAFALDFPRTTGAAAEAGRDTQAVAAASFDGLRVLVVEDNPVNQFVAQEILASLGCEVALCANGLQALDCLEHASIDLVLMDCEMPELDGLETTRRWRTREQALARPPLPIVALTANAAEDDRQQALAAGMDGFLSKPFTATAIAGAMQEALAVGHAAAPPAPASSPAPALAAG